MSPFDPRPGPLVPAADLRPRHRPGSSSRRRRRPSAARRACSRCSRASRCSGSSRSASRSRSSPASSTCRSARWPPSPAVVAVKTASTGLVGAIAIAVAMGAVIGALQGWVIARLAINSLVLTVGTLILLRGVTYLASDNKPSQLTDFTVSDPLIARYGIFSISSITALIVFVAARPLPRLHALRARDLRDRRRARGGARRRRAAAAADGPGVRALGRAAPPSPARSPRSRAAAPRRRTTRTCCCRARPRRWSAGSACTAGAARSSTSPSASRCCPPSRRGSPRAGAMPR